MDITTDNIYIAAYGTLRPGFGNNRLLIGSKHLGTGKTVEKYTMTHKGIPFVSKKPSTNIVVDVFKVDSDTLQNLDRLEGHPEWYKREEIDVILDDKILKAWLYFNEGYLNYPTVESGDYKKK